MSGNNNKRRRLNFGTLSFTSPTSVMGPVARRIAASGIPPENLAKIAKVEQNKRVENRLRAAGANSLANKLFPRGPNSQILSMFKPAPSSTKKGGKHLRTKTRRYHKTRRS